MDFTQIFQAISQPPEPGAAAPQRAAGPADLWKAFVGHGHAGYTGSASEARLAYAESRAERRERRRAAPSPEVQAEIRRHPVAPISFAPLPSVEAADIERELGLKRAAGPDALVRLRRLFASRNHPDRVDEPLRDRATTRMMIANALIDKAMRPFAGSSGQPS